MLTEDQDGRLCHFPKSPDKFVFDAEVASVFDQMAVRSIPGYLEAHEIHAKMIAHLAEQEHFTVYDVGASRGAFFRAICTQMQTPISRGLPHFNFWAIDQSPEMLVYLQQEMPWVQTLQGDATALDDFVKPADVVCMNYLLQFIPPDRESRLNVLKWAWRNLRTGGMLILGQKNTVSDTFEQWFTDEYYAFRRRNGYSAEEIAAKTAALKNSMWPMSPRTMEDLAYDAGFIDYAETTRWLQFSTSICVKG